MMKPNIRPMFFGSKLVPDDVQRQLEVPAGLLRIALTRWQDRDDSKPQAEVREAANTAMDVIDGMLADLHAMRSRLVGEIRASDDAFAARVDAMLAGAR
jgi:thiamine monophosphate kinase